MPWAQMRADTHPTMMTMNAPGDHSDDRKTMPNIPTADGGKLTTLTVFGQKIEAILVQTDEGTEREYRGRNSSRKRTITVGRQWNVFLPDGTFIGTIRYAMITRERRTGQRTYVDARWESPGWTYRTPESDGSPSDARGFEGYSKGESVERLIRATKPRSW